MRIKFLFILTSFWLFSCNSDESHLDKVQFINNYSKVDQKCEEVLLDIIQSTGIESDNYKVSELYNLDIELNSKIYGKSQFKKGIFIVAVISNDSIEISDFMKYQYMNIMPHDGRLRSCEIVDNDSVLLVNTGWEYAFNMKKLFTNACFDLDPSEDSINPNIKSEGFWSFKSSTSILGTWEKDDDRPFYLTNSHYKKQWYFEKEKVYFLNADNDTVGHSRYSISSDTLYLPDIPDTLNLHTFTNEGMVISEFLTNEVNYIYKTKEEEKN